MKFITKNYLKKELKSLEERIQEPNIVESEKISLEGSILTVEKFLRKLD